MDAVISPMLKKFFGSGPIEAGLEVGTDAGLSGDEYIKIPECCVREVYYTLSDMTLGDLYQNGVFFPLDEVVFTVKELPEDLSVLKTYNSESQRFALFGGGLFVKKLAKGGNIKQLELEDFMVDKIYCEQWSIDDVRSFLVVNDDISSLVDTPRRPFFDACRLLSIMLGVGLTDHDKEWLVVPDPPAGSQYDDSRVQDMLQAASDACTALCVRAAMFRKTKHATGGSLATGFAKKFLMQKQWPMKDASEQKRSTTDFYKAVHAASPIALLAMIAPHDPGHFAVFNPICGLRGALKVHASVTLRVSGPDQVAGGSMIADALVVLKMLKSENIIPLIKNVTYLEAFGTLHKTLREAGFRAHNAYGYYSEFHPFKTLGEAVRFDQRDPSCFPLVCELATIAVNYYQGRTIANSPSLRTADQSSEDAGIGSLWKAISLIRKSAPRDVIMTYYGAMKGEDIAKTLGKIVEADDATFDNEKQVLQDSINTALESFDLPNFRIDLTSLSKQALADAKENYERIKSQMQE